MHIQIYNTCLYQYRRILILSCIICTLIIIHIHVRIQDKFCCSPCVQFCAWHGMCSNISTHRLSNYMSASIENFTHKQPQSTNIDELGSNINYDFMSVSLKHLNLNYELVQYRSITWDCRASLQTESRICESLGCLGHSMIAWSWIKAGMKDASIDGSRECIKGGAVHCPKLPIEMHQSTDPKVSGMISTNQPDLCREYTLKPCNLKYQTNRVLMRDSNVTPWDAPVTSRDSTTTYLYITFIMSYHFFRVGTLFLPDLMFISTRLVSYHIYQISFSNSITAVFFVLDRPGAVCGDGIPPSRPGPITSMWNGGWIQG